MSPDPPRAAARLAHARAHLIARRMWIFALGWVTTLLAWLVVFVAHGRIGLVGAATFLLGNIALLAGLGMCARRRPVPTWIREAACGVCIVLGIALGLLGMAVQVSGDVLAFALLTLYLMSALLFGWGWRAEGALLVGTMLPLGIMIPRLEFLVAPAELATALAVGAALCLAVAEGTARVFRVALLRLESAEEAARAVAASRDAYRDLAENSRDYIYAGDLRGHITYLNQAAATVIGRTAAELVGTSVLEFVTDHPENPTFEGVLEGLLADEPPPPFRVQVMTLRGPRWFGVMASLIRDGSGRATGVRGISRDIDERVRAERQLRESEERYRSLVETQLEAVVRWDLEGRVTFANEYWLRTTGVPAQEMLGASTLHLIHPDDRDLVAEAMRLLGDGAMRQRRQNRIRTVDGFRWFEWEGCAIADEAGRTVEFQGIGRDIHEGHVAEEALRESEARYRVLVESQQAFLTRADAAGVLTFVNDHVCTAVGRTRDELLGTSFLDYLHPDDMPVARGMIAALSVPPYRAGPREMRSRTGFGWRWFEWEGIGIVDDGGALAEIHSLGRDVTDRREADEALRRSEAQYRGVVESQHDLVFRGDTEGRTVFVNDAWCRSFGVRAEDMIGRSFAPFVYPEDLEHTLAMLRSLQKPPYRATFQDRSYDAEGRLRWIEWEGGGIADASGRIVEIQGVGRDVTHRKHAEEALQRSLEELQRSQGQLRSLAQRQVAIREQERKRLGLDLHDDVCQELVGIGIMIESIRRRLGPIATESAREFDRIGGYLGQLVDHLRLLARELQPLQLPDLGLQDSLRSLMKGFSSASCSVEPLFPTAIPRLAEEAEVGVYRIAQEALTNAIRHAEAGSVRLMLAVVGNKLRLEVSDDGRGFDPEVRVNALGLVSMEERALSLGGCLTIWSTKGGGTTVRLECPLGDPASASAA